MRNHLQGNKLERSWAELKFRLVKVADEVYVDVLVDFTTSLGGVLVLEFELSLDCFWK